jgi:predicted methyltransferase
MRASIFLTLATSALAFAAPGYAGETTPVSAAAAEAVVPDFEAAVITPGRDDADIALDESRDPAAVLAFMGLETGDAVLDIFAGGGYYSEILGRAVGPDGTVIAVNPPQFVSSEQSRAKWASVTARQPNVTMVPSQLPDYKPAANSIDFAMLHLIYHDFYWQSEKFKFDKMDPAVVLANMLA